MVPRTEIDVFQRADIIEDILEELYAQQHTRFPVADGDKDSIIGLINTKELMTACLKSRMKMDMPIEPFIKPIITVIESIPIHDLLIRMQKEQTHMAVLIDEYGGTSGIVTVEDILEEIVGEIRDEFDDDELPEIRQLGDHHYIVDSKLLLSEVNDLLGIHIENPDVDTIGGWYLTHKMDVKVGDSIEEEGYIFTITEAEDYHILYIEIKKAA